VTTLRGSQVELTSCDVRLLHEGRWTLLIRMASSPTATAAQAAEARRLLSVTSHAVSGEEEQTLWARQIHAPWLEGGTTLRLSWSPANFSAVVSSIESLGSRGCRLAAFVGRTMGAGLVMLDGDEREMSGAIAGLRTSTHLGHVVIVRAGRGIKMRTDVWGPDSGGIEVARALKRTFDPQGILNAGRGPI
jgi:FAD/FMN-containing dehydrogenase